MNELTPLLNVGYMVAFVAVTTANHGREYQCELTPPGGGDVVTETGSTPAWALNAAMSEMLTRAVAPRE